LSSHRQTNKQGSTDNQTGQHNNQTGQHNNQTGQPQGIAPTGKTVDDTFEVFESITTIC